MADTPKTGRGHKRATDEEVAVAYRETGSVWKAAKRIGLSGQTVHERLGRMGIKPGTAKWTPEEDEELRALFGDPHLSISEIARRLNRTSASVSCRAGELKIAKTIGKKRPPRGKGYDKASVKRHLKSFESFDGTLTKFCRANRLAPEAFAVAVQRHFPQWWEEHSASAGLEEAECAYCGDSFFPTNKRQTFCTRKCSADMKRDESYFGGKRLEGKGVREKQCQLCNRYIEKNLHVHHVYGKLNDPENDHLVALCGGCHMLIEQATQHGSLDSKVTWIRLMKFVWLKRHGWRDEYAGKELSVFLSVDVSDS